MKTPISIKNYRFDHICEIKLERDPENCIKTYCPQNQYQNKKNLNLHAYGSGEFCKFKIPSNLHLSGVYVITVDQKPCYVGECMDLTKRFNAGYGNISPKNCYKGGQPTNCRINQLILEAVAEGRPVDLFFHPTAKHKEMEKDILIRKDWTWNK